MKRAVIYTGGDPAAFVPRGNDFVVCADSGYAQVAAMGRVPDLVVGDFDSQDRASVDAREVIALPAEKDDTDTHFAAKEVLRRGYRDVVIVGGTGGLLHHTLANVATLYLLREQGARAILVSGRNRLAVIRDETRVVTANAGDWLSVFPQGGTARGVYLRGLKYPLTDATLTPDFPVGACNEFFAGSAEVEVRDGTLLVVITEREA